MISFGQSDLASTIRMSLQNTRVKEALLLASTELSTGQKNDLVNASAGDLGKLFAIDRVLSRVGVDFDAIRLAAGKAALTQVALENIHENLRDFGPQLLSAVERGDVQSSRHIANDARHGLESVVASLNTRFGRHSLFSGAAVDQLAIAPATQIISDISAIIIASVDTATAIMSIDEYFFDPSGGFEANIFLGSTQDAPSFQSEGDEEIRYAQRADTVGIRSAIRTLAIAAASAGVANFAGATDQSDLLREAGTSALSAAGAITELRETLGFMESRIENVSARNRAMNNVLELERASIISADPFEAATKFEALQVQLQTIYTITSRISNLSLTSFLR